MNCNRLSYRIGVNRSGHRYVYRSLRAAPREPWRRTAAAIAGMASLSALVACGNVPTIPSESLRSPIVASLVIEPSTLRAYGGVAVVSVVLRDPSRRLGDGERIALSLVTSTGDKESVQAEPIVCRLPSGADYKCRTFNLAVNTGYHVEDLLPHLQEIDGQVIWIGSTGEHATIKIASAGNDALEIAMQRASRWPGVLWVELSLVGYIQGGPPPAAAQITLPIEAAHVIVGDHRLQATTGETISASYQQPGGDVLVASARVP